MYLAKKEIKIKQVFSDDFDKVMAIQNRSFGVKQQSLNLWLGNYNCGIFCLLFFIVFLYFHIGCVVLLSN
jgi:hypothetical protein